MNSPATRHVGVTVMPEFYQVEGVEAVLDNLARLGVTSVTTMPSVAAEVPEGQGSREPPLDGGAGAVRVLDRALWGGRFALHMVTAPSFVPNGALYGSAGYRPPPATTLTQTQGPRVAEFIAAAKARGLTVFLQVMAAIPPCYRVQFGGPEPADRPLLPGGEPLPPRVDNNASLASGAVRRYVRAMVADLCAAYPGIDGIRFDWPEYPPYHFASLFADYNPQVRPYAEAAGLDVDRLEAAMAALLARFRRGEVPGGLAEAPGLEGFLDGLAAHEPAIRDHLRLRQYLVADYARFLCETVREASGGTKQVFLQTFPPPWDRLSGFSPAALSALADVVGVKFYTMHWPMMLRNYVDAVAGATGQQPDRVAAAVYRLFVSAEGEAPGVDAIAYPEPHEPHGIGAEIIAAKLAAAQAGATRPLMPIAHSYGPIEDVCRRLEGAWRASGGRVEINRYGYMSDAKIAAMARVLAI